MLNDLVAAGFSLRDQLSCRIYINLLKSKYGSKILKAVLFGSAARGEAGRESDADILIVVADADTKLKDEISMQLMMSCLQTMSCSLRS